MSDTSLNNIVTELQLFNQGVYDLYLSDTNSENTPVTTDSVIDTAKINIQSEKWTKIATMITDQRKLLTDFFHHVKENSNIRNYVPNYELKLSQIMEQISSEADLLQKCSLIVLSLHQMVYDLLSTEPNYYFMLRSADQMNIDTINTDYYINLSAKTSQNLYFHAFILIFGLESVFINRLYVGADFEFTNRIIQMAQLNFEHSVDRRSIIQMVSPTELEPEIMDDFINLIMCNSRIKKILHGSDSLDIPYIYGKMLNADPDLIREFTKALIDTRFLCEYYKLNKAESLEYRCAIYDEDPNRSAIYYFGLVNETQQQKLSQLITEMPVDIQWNIHRLFRAQVLYAQYDVLFLKYFYYRIIHVATSDVQSDTDKKNVITLYKHVLTQLTQLVYLENNGITFLRSKCKEEVDIVNNYFIRKPNQIIKLIDIFNQVSVGLNTTSPVVNIDSLLKVNHFKSTTNLIIKRMVYGHLSMKCKVHKDRTTVWTDKMTNNFILDFLAEVGFEYLHKMFTEINKILEARVLEICRG